MERIKAGLHAGSQRGWMASNRLDSCPDSFDIKVVVASNGMLLVR
jgi:hypothetical protein